MKIAYPLKQDATDPRVVLDANLSVICTFLEGEHAEEMVRRMNATDMDEVRHTAQQAEFAIGKLKRRIEAAAEDLAKAEDVVSDYVSGIVLMETP
jgi:hypothetical protein